MQFKLIVAQRQILEGERIPKWYGIAYHDPNSMISICYPFPFNIIIGWVRKVWLNFRWYYVGVDKREKELRLANHHGYMQGYDDAIKFADSMMIRLHKENEKLTAQLEVVISFLEEKTIKQKEDE